MAELPEVETMRRDLEREVGGQHIERAVVWQTRMRRAQTADEMERRLAGRRLGRVDRRGKFLLLGLDNDDTLLLHRGMTGNLFLRRPEDPPDPHLHLTLGFEDGRELRLTDHRGFGEMRVLEPGEVRELDERLGPEPLGPAFTPEYLAAQFARRTTLAKALLLNQAIVAGLGNIYVDEALWEAGVHPERRANTLPGEQVRVLHRAVVQFLGEAIERRGTTFSDYKDLYGNPGGNSAHLRVFHRIGEPCLRCGTPVVRILAAGRGSSICPSCQQLDPLHIEAAEPLPAGR